ALMGRAAPALQAPHCKQGMVNPGRHHLVLDRPFEDGFDASDLPVDVGAAPPQADHFLAYGLERFRTEVRGVSLSIEPPQGPKGVAIVVQLSSHGTVLLAVVNLGMLPEGM